MRRFEVDPLAYEELLAAVSWYEEQREGLGSEFLAEVERRLRWLSTVDELVTAPVERIDDVTIVRRELLRRFPYVIVFVETSALRKVILIHRSDSDPERWRARTRR